MAHHVLLTLEFDADDLDQLRDIINDVAVEVASHISEEPMMGLEVDGEHRDPDDPSEGL